MASSGLMGTVGQVMGDDASLNNLGDAEATAPNPYDKNDPKNREKISALIDKLLKVNESTRSAFEWAAFRNLCLIAGQHDIIKLQGQVKLRNIPKYFPRTQTNKFREKRNDLISAVAQGRVPIKHLPATDDDEAHATADIAERVRDVVYTEAELDGKESEIAGWFIDTGNVFLYPYYDYDEKYGTVETPKHGCAGCGETYGADDLAEHDVDENAPMCPACGPDIEGGQNGNPPSPLQPSSETELLPIGALCVDVLSMFEVRGDYRIRDSRLWTWWIRIQRYDVSYAKEKFGYSGGDEETGDDGNALSQHYLDVIASLSDQFNPQSGFGNTAQGSSKVPKVTAYTLFMLPNEDFPEGLCAKRIGRSVGNVIDIDPLDTEYGVGIRKGQKFLPLVHGRAVLQSGRLLGSSPLDDAVPLQHFRNRVERAIDMEIRRMANSIWMNPKGSGVDLFNGEAGWICNYNPFAVGGTTIAKPERIIPQLQYLQYLIETLKQIDDQIERATGTYFLQGGENPSGVSAACCDEATEALTRRGWKKHFDIKPGDEIYGYDPATNEGVWTLVKGLHVYPEYSGLLFEAEHKNISFCVTPNHAWYVGNHRKKKQGIQRVEMQDIKQSHYVPATFPLKFSSGHADSDAFIEVLGWIFTEGSYEQRPTAKNKKCTISITQSKTANPEKCIIIRHCLQAAGIPFSEKPTKKGTSVRFRIYSDAARNIMSRFPDKRPGFEYVGTLSQHQASLLCEAMLLGDGEIKNSSGHKTYASSDPILLEQFQMVATIAGHATATSSRPGRKKHKGPQYGDRFLRCSLKRSKKIYFHSLLSKPDSVKRKKLHVAFKKQLVWCPETEQGTWLARRNGKVYVTGNSALALLDSKAKKAIGPMVREWAKMFLELDKMTLEIARKHWNDKRILIAAGKNKDFEVASFTNADLQGGVVMDVDYQSLFPQSEATERAEIEQLIQGGIINPQDPEQALEVLRKFGKMSMLPSSDDHTRRAKIEQSEFLKTGVPPKLLPLIHNSMIHIREHVKFGNTDEFMKLAPDKQELWMAHIQAHFVDEGARRGLLAQMQVNPDAPGTVDLTGGGVAAAAQGAQSTVPQQSGATAGNQVGSRAPKGTTGAGPNQAKAADARSQQVLTQPADLAGAVEPGQ